MKNLWNKFTDKFGNTIIHPQFIILSYPKNAIIETLRIAKNKKLIDIGCGRMQYRKLLETVVKSYTGVDDPKVSNLYSPQNRPEIIADVTKKIPIKSNVFDIAIMLEVLEYLERPQKTFDEISRILKPKGILILTTPFLYPVHDIPYDRNRFTDTQIKYYLKNSNFKVKKIKVNGGFIDFWFQSINVFLFKRIMDIIKKEKTLISIFYLFLLLLITPSIVILTNVIYIFTKKIKLNYPNYFPLNYMVIAVRE